MLILTLFFGKLTKVPSDGVPYPQVIWTGVSTQD
jgi:hypothetical protein